MRTGDLPRGWREAQATLLRAIAGSRARRPWATVALARSLRRLGRHDEAIAELESLLAQTEPEALERVIGARRIHGPVAAARRPRPAVWEELGRSLAARRDLHAACAALDESLRHRPERLAVQRLLARCLVRAGEYPSARDVVGRALQRAPRDQGLLRLRERIDADVRVYRGEACPVLTPQARLEGRRGCVLHVVEHSLPHRRTGYAQRTQYVLRALAAAGLEVSAITRPGFPRDIGVRAPASERVDGVTYARCEIDGPARLSEQRLDHYVQRYAEAVADAARRIRPELLHAASNFKNALAARAAADALAIPWVYEVRGLWEDSMVARGETHQGSQIYRFLQDVETRCMTAADAVVVLSEGMRADAVARGVEADRVFVVPNAVDVATFTRRDPPTRLRESLGLGAGPIVGYVGSLNAYEGLDLLIRALPAIDAPGPPARVLIVGEGDARAGLEALATDLGVRDRVVFTGPVPHAEVRDYYALLDLFVLPRRPLRVCQLVPPLKPFEAMCAGRAVVASDVGALGEIVADGATGALFRAGNVGHLAQVCAGLLRDRERRVALGEAAERWVRANHRWTDVTDRYRSAYDRAKSSRKIKRK